jgi:hypothetical protein
MKKIAVVLVVLCVMFAVAGCGTKPAAQSDQGSGLPDIVRNARKNAPEGVLIGIGSSSNSPQSMARNVAETRARGEIARAMNSMVRNMISDYTANSETDRNAVLSFQESITTSLAEARLQGAVIHDEDYIKGTYYVVIYLSKSDVAREIMSATEASRRLAPAAMASFNAQDRMDAMFERELSQEVQVRDRD